MNYSFIENKSFNTLLPEKELADFSADSIKNVLRFQETHPSYAKSQLHNLTDFAEEYGVRDIKVKDESSRFGLNAFKAMGSIYAMGKYVADRAGNDIKNLTFDDLKSYQMRKAVGNLTFTTATDGNHGRAVAWAAKELGQNAVVYIPKGSMASRLEAIRDEGAFAEATGWNYDETVRVAARIAHEQDWALIQDTSWEGYKQIPLRIMQGYAAIGREVIEELENSHEQPPTHIFLQAGVGSFAAAIVAYFKHYYKKKAPVFVVVEPRQADCHFRSFSDPDGKMNVVSGEMSTIMAGLVCGRPSTLAFRILKNYANASFSCDDDIAATGMRILGNPLGHDLRIISGESGAVTIGLVHQLLGKGNDKARKSINLDEKSRILVINTEGGTNLQQYRDIVWKGYYPTKSN